MAEQGAGGRSSRTACVIVGGGRAGMVLGLLLARRGVGVQALEKHGDFERDFRGDTIHPSTLEMLDRIGFAGELHELGHGKLRAMRLVTPGRTWDFVELHRLKTRFPYVMIAPQARFLEFLHRHAGRYPGFSLSFHAIVQELVQEDDAVKGVRYKDADGAGREMRAPLTVAADGRSSQVARLAGLEPREQPEIDVLWLRLPRKDGDRPDEGALYVGEGQFMVVFERESEWQAGYVIPKGNTRGFARPGSHGCSRMWRGSRRGSGTAWARSTTGGRPTCSHGRRGGGERHRRPAPAQAGRAARGQKGESRSGWSTTTSGTCSRDTTRRPRGRSSRGRSRGGSSARTGSPS